MSPKSKSGKAMGSDLRVMGEQRARELAGQVDPAAEARTRERRLLEGLGGAAADLEWLATNQAWTLLGHDTCAAWWAARVKPVADELGFQPSRELGMRFVELIRAEEASLPAAQRRSTKELAAFVGVSEWAARGRKETRQRRTAAGSDLDSGSNEVIDGEIVPEAEPAPADIPAALGQAIADTAASVGAGVDMPPAAPVGVLCWSAPDREHCAGCGKPIPMHEQNGGTLRCSDCDPTREHYAVGIGVDEGHGECDACTRLVRLAQDPAAVTAESPEPGPNGLGEPAGADQAAALAGTPTGDGLPLSPVGDQDEERIEEEAVEPPADTPTGGVVDPSSVGATNSPAGQDSSVATTDRPGHDHQQVAGVSPAGEAPAPPVAVEPELEDGGYAPPRESSSSSDQLMAAFSTLLLHLADADAEAIGPLLHDDDVEQLLLCADNIQDFIARLIKARTP